MKKVWGWIKRIFKKPAKRAAGALVDKAADKAHDKLGEK